MNPKLRKANQILKKYFHFTQSQVDESEKKGLKVMNKEDIKYLTNFKNERGALDSFGNFDSYTTLTVEELLEVLEVKKAKGFAGVKLWNVKLPNLDQHLLDDHEYFREIVLSSPTLDYIFFSEEEYVRFKISNFQNLFSSFETIVKQNII
ncbi:MAG: hypothetical protein QG630_402 [Patescibacteria group bacterium]|nr:hypothetical protein [Patescibacteria group bacterium]